jgi:hypothetical protein
MRCYFIRENKIEAVELLKNGSDAELIRQAARLANSIPVSWERYEVWEGRRLVYRYPPATSASSVSSS